MTTMFTNKTPLITGGTRTFDNAVLRRFWETEIGEIWVFSSGEKKQDDMRKHFNHQNIRFYIGDMLNESSLSGTIHRADFVFHAAALKQVTPGDNMHGNG